MTSPIDLLRETYFINAYPPSDNPRSPLATIELVDKQTREKFRHTVWRDKEDNKKAYLTKAESAQAYPAKQNTEGKVTKDVAGIHDDFGDDCPF